MKIFKPILLFLFTGLIFVISCDEDELPSGPNPIIKVTGGAIDFGSVDVNTESDVSSYTIGAQDLTGPIEITTAAPFSISTNFDTGFGNSLTLNPGDFGNEATVVYVKFSPTGGENVDYSGLISHTSQDREEVASITLSGRGTIPVPSISLSTPTLLFSGITVGEDSMPQVYVITGENLSSTLTVSTEAPFSISLSEMGTFGTSIDIPAASFDATGSVNVYARFSPSAAGDVEATIDHSSDDLASIPSVLVTGTTAVISTLQVSEVFDYPVGDVPSTDRTGDGTANAAIDGWIKVRTGNANIPIVDDRLSYPGYDLSGMGNAVRIDMDDPGSNSNVYANNMVDQQDAGEVGSYYAAFMLRIDALPQVGSGAPFVRPIMFVDWLSDGATRFLGSLRIDANAGDPKFAVMYGAEFSLSDITPETGKTYLVVVKNTVTDDDVNNDNNTGSIYIFDAEALPTVEPIMADATITVAPGDDTYGVKAIAFIRDFNRAGNCVIDGLKVTRTWGELFE